MNYKNFLYFIIFYCILVNVAYSIDGIYISGVANSAGPVDTGADVQISLKTRSQKLSFNYKKSKNYLIINFNKQASYKVNLKNMENLVEHSFASLDKKSFFIKFKQPLKYIAEPKKDASSAMLYVRLLPKVPEMEFIQIPLSNNFPDKTKEKTQQTNLELMKIDLVNSDQDSIILGFNLPDSIGTAAFSRGEYSWIILDKLMNIDLNLLKGIGVFEEVKQIPHEAATIIRLKHNLTGEMKVDSQNGKKLITIFRNDALKSLPKILINEFTNSSSLGRVFRAIEPNKAIIFNEEITGDKISIIPLRQADMGVAIPRKFIDFIVLRSAQGFIVSHLSEEVIINVKKDYIEVISSNYAMDINLEEQVKDKIRDNLLKENNSSNLVSGQITMLPVLESPEDEKMSFLDRYTNIVKKNLQVADRNALNRNHYELAKFYFLNEMYNEAAAIEYSFNFYNRNNLISKATEGFLYAVSLTLSGKYNEAEATYKELLKTITNSKNINEIELWQNVNDNLNHKQNNYIGLLKNIDSLVFAYPDNIFWKLALLEIETALEKNDLDTAKEVFLNLRSVSPLDIKLLQNIKFLKAKLAVLKKEYEQAKIALQELKNDNSNAQMQIRAELEEIKLYYLLKEINRDQVIGRLNNLKQNWRGDFVEYEILLYLGKLYKENGALVQALKNYKYLVEAFDSRIDKLFITAEMTDLFNKIFEPGGLTETMKDFETVSLFYQFKELTPIGMKGDRIVTLIASRLLNLDLIETAEALLTHQISYRLSGDKKVEVGNYLAYIYLKNKKPDSAIKILEQTDKENFTYPEYLKRIRLKAKAYVDKGNFDMALNLIKDDFSPQAAILREEVYFKNREWNKLIDLLETDIIEKINKKEKFFKEDESELIKLLISYSMTENYDKLKFINENIITTSPYLKNLLDFFSSQGKSIDYKNLEEGLNIKNIENFLEIIKKDIITN